jgi:hypothetical protein
MSDYDYDDAEEAEGAIVVATYPRDGIATGVREVAFGPASDRFALLWEIDPSDDNQMYLTIGNSPATAELPTVIPGMLRELADYVEAFGERADFLDWVYGTDEEDDEE